MTAGSYKYAGFGERKVLCFLRIPADCDLRPHRHRLVRRLPDRSPVNAADPSRTAQAERASPVQPSMPRRSTAPRPAWITGTASASTSIVSRAPFRPDRPRASSLSSTTPDAAKRWRLREILGGVGGSSPFVTRARRRSPIACVRAGSSSTHVASSCVSARRRISPTTRSIAASPPFSRKFVERVEGRERTPPNSLGWKSADQRGLADKRLLLWTR